MEFEKCIICGAETDVPRNRHIDLRDCYVEGAGQCCPRCYRSTVGVNCWTEDIRYALV